LGLQKCYKYIKENKEIYLFMAPAVIAFIVFIIYPIIASWRYAFYDWSGMGSLTNAEFIGLDNFKEILSDSYFWNALKHNAIYTLSVVPLTLIFSLILALILNTKMKGKVIYRTILFLPAVTSLAIIGVLMTFIFSATGGPVNDILKTFNIIERPIDWLGNPNYSMRTVVAVSIWQIAGMYVIYWLAGLQTIPKELYEAADVDGASFFAKFRHITLPMLKNYAVIISTLAIVGSLRVFDLIMTMTGGGPFNATEVVTLFIYSNAFGSSVGMPRIGYASAAAVVFGLMVAVVTFAVNYFKGREDR